MITEISVAMVAGIGLGKLAAVIHPYPTQAEAIRQCGDALQPNPANSNREKMDAALACMAKELKPSLTGRFPVTQSSPLRA
jgi:hypothetical protein